MFMMMTMMNTAGGVTGSCLLFGAF